MVHDNCGTINWFLLTCVGVLILLCWTIVTVALIPCYFFRWTLTKLQVIFRPNFYKVLPATSTIWALRGIYDSPCANVIFCLKFSGTVNFEAVTDRISKHVLARSCNNGEFLHPEFQMKLVKWFGYWFWEPETEFKFHNHVFRQQVPINQDDSEFVATFERNFLKQKFEEGLSPWKLAFIESSNMENPSWFLLFKFHHSLADGFGIFNIFMKCTDNYKVDDAEKMEEPLDENPWRKLSRFLNFIIAIPFDTAKSVLDFSLSKPWVLTLKKSTLDRVIVKSELILSSDLKKIASENNTSFSVVILAILTSGIRNILKKQDNAATMPEYISSTFPIPRPDRPAGLVNHFTAIAINLPIGAHDNKDRLQICERRLRKGKNSTMPICFSAMLELIGNIPSSFIPAPYSIPGLQITCFAGPRQQISLNGQQVLDMHFNLWCSEISSVLLCVLSYNGGVRVIANADKVIFPTEKSLQELMDGIEQEIRLLQKDTNERSDENNNCDCSNGFKRRNVNVTQ